MLDLISVGGNLGSITRAIARLGEKFRLVCKGSELIGENPIVLPGVGSFGAFIKAINQSGLKYPLISAIKSGAPFLGICVGMQVLFDKSEESPDVKGLGIISGDVVRFKAPKVPQVGWNRITPRREGYEKGHVYFVNSYYARPQDESVILYTADYGGTFCAAVKHKNITAFQFHPEKSLYFGQSLLRRWLDAL